MRTLLLLLGFIAAAGSAGGPPANDEARAQRSDEGVHMLRLAQAEEEAEPEDEKEETESGKEAGPRARSKGPPQRFIPSEKISADSAVSFPVDI